MKEKHVQTSGVREKVLSWYLENKRDLPWRRGKDPYRIWISEIMLQQTQVTTVIPYYNNFIKRFPTVRSLSTAEVDEVLSLWSGLGYYSRARALHRAACKVVEEHDGLFPRDRMKLMELPGVGPYTAGAILAIAFDMPEAAVDGNVTRALSRIYGVRDDVTKMHAKKKIDSFAQSLMTGSTPGDFCQALMEFGSVVCRPRSPRCPKCVVNKFCDAFAKGDVEQLPHKPLKTAPTIIIGASILLSRRQKFLAVKRPERGLLGGLWDFPGGEVRKDERPEAGLRRSLLESLGLVLGGSLEETGRIVHLFTHRKLILYLFRGEINSQRVRRRGFAAHRWVSLKTFLDLPHSSLTAKAFHSLNLKEIS